MAGMKFAFTALLLILSLTSGTAHDTPDILKVGKDPIRPFAVHLPALAGDSAPSQQLIAFLSDREQPTDPRNLASLYVLQPDGLAMWRLATAVAWETLSWSPDSTQVAFTVGSFPGDIFVVRADGSGLRNVTNSPLDEYDPAWSPDGTRIAFVDWSDQLVNLINVDGTGRVQIGTGVYGNHRPQWSPDGKKLAFASDYGPNPGDKGGVFVMDPDGSNLTKVADRVFELIRWSPDGSRLAMSPISLRSQVYVVNKDGSGFVQVTDGSLSDPKAPFNGIPSWSPDGQRLAFVSSRDGRFNLYSMKPDGTEVVRLTTGNGTDTWPAWSPDGARIAFQSSRDGNWEIYVMNSDGSGQRNVTNDPSNDEYPKWAPAPKP